MKRRTGVVSFVLGDPVNRRGGHVLVWGLGAYLITLLFFIVLKLWSPTFAERGLLLLVIVPPLLLFLLPGLAWTIFFVGSVTGTPSVSFSFGFAWIRRTWRGIMGGMLILNAIGALWSFIYDWAGSP